VAVTLEKHRVSMRSTIPARIIHNPTLTAYVTNTARNKGSEFNNSFRTSEFVISRRNGSWASFMAPFFTIINKRCTRLASGPPSGNLASAMRTSASKNSRNNTGRRGSWEPFPRASFCRSVHSTQPQQHAQCQDRPVDGGVSALISTSPAATSQRDHVQPVRFLWCGANEGRARPPLS